MKNTQPELDAQPKVTVTVKLLNQNECEVRQSNALSRSQDLPQLLRILFELEEQVGLG